MIESGYLNHVQITSNGPTLNTGAWKNHNSNNAGTANTQPFDKWWTPWMSSPMMMRACGYSSWFNTTVRHFGWRWLEQCLLMTFDICCSMLPLFCNQVSDPQVIANARPHQSRWWSQAHFLRTPKLVSMHALMPTTLTLFWATPCPGFPWTSTWCDPGPGWEPSEIGPFFWMLYQDL